MQELNKKIIKWAEDKGIMSKATPLSQFTKTFEEVGELITALITKDEAEIKDAIGDIKVTLVILGKLLETAQASDHLKNSSVFMLVNWVIEVLHKMSSGKNVSLDITRTEHVLAAVAQENGLTLEDCTQSAYDVISKRTGKMVGGVFVKDEVKPEIVERKDISKTKKPKEVKGG